MTIRDGRTHLEYHRRLSIPRQRIHKSPLSSALTLPTHVNKHKDFLRYDQSAVNNRAARRKRMSQYQQPVEGASSPALSATTTSPQRRGPVSPHGTEQPQGAGGSEEHSERDTDALDMSQALGEIRQVLCQLHSTFRNNRSEPATPYQQASFGVLTNIADDIAECLHWLRRMGSTREEVTARPGQPRPRPDVPNDIEAVLQGEGARTGDHQTAYPAPGVLPADGSRGVAPPAPPPPPAFQATGPYEMPTGAGQVLHGATGGYAYNAHQDTNPHALPYIQSHMPFPPSPGLYHSQWVQSPPIPPLITTSFCHHHPFVSPATNPNQAVVLPPPPPPNTTPNHIHQGTSLRDAQGQQQQQGQPHFPSPGSGVTTSFPLHYDTPAGPRVTLYQSYLPDHHPLDLSPRPVFGGPGALGARQVPAASPAAAAQELEADPPRGPAGPDGHRSSARPSDRFARVESDSEDDLDSPGPELRWSGVFEGGFSP